jgi:hypothetical protein
MAPSLLQHKAGSIQVTEEAAPPTNKENNSETSPNEKPPAPLSRLRRAFDRIEVWLVGNQDSDTLGDSEDSQDDPKSSPKTKRLYDTPWPPVMKRPPPKPQNGWLRVLELSGNGDSRPVPPGMDGQAESKPERPEKPEKPEEHEEEQPKSGPADPAPSPSRDPGVPVGSSSEESSEGSEAVEKRDLAGMQQAAEDVRSGEKMRVGEGRNPFVQIRGVEVEGRHGGHHTESHHRSEHHSKTHHSKTHHTKTRDHHTKTHHTKSHHTSHHTKHHKTTTAELTSTGIPATSMVAEPTPAATSKPSEHGNIELHHLPDDKQDLFFADSNHPAILNSASPSSSSAELLAEGHKSGSIEDAHHGSKLKHNGDDATKHKLTKGYEIKHNKRAPPPLQPSRTRTAAAGKGVPTRMPVHAAHAPHDMTVKEEEDKWKAGYDRSTSPRDRAVAKMRIEKLAAELEREREAGRERAEEAAERLAKAAAGREGAKEVGVKNGRKGDYLDHDSYDPANAHVYEEVNRMLDGAAEEEGRRDAAATLATAAAAGRAGRFPSYQSLREASDLGYDSVKGQFLALHTASGEPSDLGLLLTIFMWVVLVVLILRCQRGRGEGVRWQSQGGGGGWRILGRRREKKVRWSGERERREREGEGEGEGEGEKLDV